MIENLFGGFGKGNNDILLILLVLFLLFNNSKDDCHGGHGGLFGGKGGLFGGDNIIWILLILLFLGGGDIFGLGDTQ